jgi:uncharacterized protein with PQ loop repeat
MKKQVNGTLLTCSALLVVGLIASAILLPRILGLSTKETRALSPDFLVVAGIAAAVFLAAFIIRRKVPSDASFPVARLIIATLAMAGNGAYAALLVSIITDPRFA